MKVGVGQRQAQRLLADCRGEEYKAAMAARRDPKNGHLVGRRKNKKSMENTTACRIPPPPHASLEALIAAVKDLTTPDFERFKAWFRGYCGA
jgi:hypothetical protein